MRFGYALLFVADVEKTVAFYEAAFGLKRKAVQEGGYAEMDTGATKLGFVSHALAESAGATFTRADAGRPAPAMEIALVADDVEAAYARALAKGATAAAPPATTPWGQTVAYVRDLDGFLVELCTAIPD